MKALKLNKPQRSATPTAVDVRAQSSVERKTGEKKGSNGNKRGSIVSIDPSLGTPIDTRSKIKLMSKKATGNHYIKTGTTESGIDAYSLVIANPIQKQRSQN